MIHLLSTQSLLDAVAGRARVTAWLQKTPLRDVEISAVSIGQSRDAISRQKPAKRQKLEGDLDLFIATLDIHDGIVALDAEAASIWAQLLGVDLPYKVRNGPDTELSVASRMVVATALSRGATLVEAPQPYHRAILGLKVFSP